MMHLPKFPQFDEVTATPTTNVETIQNKKLLFNMGVSTKDSKLKMFCFYCTPIYLLKP